MARLPVRPPLWRALPLAVAAFVAGGSAAWAQQTPPNDSLEAAAMAVAPGRDAGRNHDDRAHPKGDAQRALRADAGAASGPDAADGIDDGMQGRGFVQSGGQHLGLDGGALALTAAAKVEVQADGECSEHQVGQHVGHRPGLREVGGPVSAPRLKAS